MRPFRYEYPADRADALRLGSASVVATASAQNAWPVQYLAGGTTLIDLMKLDVMRPATVVDINALAHDHAAIGVDPHGLTLGALARMADVADDARVRREYPAIAQSLSLAASAQLRNMATLGGNVLQRTRCIYFRDTSYVACNKRVPGSGCSAIGGINRTLGILGVSDKCIANYPGDFAVVLAALDATVDIEGANGRRTISFESLHRLPGETPHIETTLRPGELITGFAVPAGPWARRSAYLKIRDRHSYQFALASAAVALDIQGGVVRQSRIGLGGIAGKPWRSHEAEAVLQGKPVTEANAEAVASVALANAAGHGGAAFKPELARRTLVRALMQAAKMEA